MKSIIWTWLLIVSQIQGNGQSTSGELIGNIKTNENNPIAGVTISLMHRATGIRFQTLTDRNGRFYLAGIHPGNTYTLHATHIQCKPLQLHNIEIETGTVTEINLIMKEKAAILKEVTVQTSIGKEGKYSNDFGSYLFTRPRLNQYASGEKNLQDVLNYLPGVLTDAGGAGSISIGGENYRYNAVYTDGAQTHDQFGISPSGTFGGVTGTAPLPLEALEYCKIVFNPSDVRQGHFTGGAIQSITRKGTNHPFQTWYQYLQDAALTGRTAFEINNHIYPSGYQSVIRGMNAGGAFKKNRIFYFINLEQQEKQIPETQPLERYAGSAFRLDLLPIIRNQLQSTYGYDAGSFRESNETLLAKKLFFRVDAHVKNNAQLILSVRYFNAMQQKPGIGNANEIHFANSGYLLYAENYAVQLENRKMTPKNISVQWFANYTYAGDIRKPIGKPFPSIKIIDGDGSLMLGSDIYSGLNATTQQIFFLRQLTQWNQGKHLLSAGIECTYAHFSSLFVPGGLGYAIYAQPADFILEKAPVYYKINYQPNQPASLFNRVPTKYATSDLSIFFSDRIRLHPKWVIWLGGTIQKSWFWNKPVANQYVNNNVIPALEKYRSLEGAITGKTPILQWSIAPRISAQWMISARWKMEMIAGYLIGRMPIVWPGSVYSQQGENIVGWVAGESERKYLRLQKLVQTGNLIQSQLITPNAIPLHLAASKLNLPVSGRLHWQVSYQQPMMQVQVSAMYTQAIREPAFTQVNILPPIKQSAGAGARNVYPIEGGGRIPLDAAGNNPYDHAILLHSRKNSGAGGWQLSLSSRIQLMPQLSVEAAYGYQDIKSVRDGTGSWLGSVWQQTETIQGKNDPDLSISDFSRKNKMVLGMVKTFAGYQSNRMMRISFVCVVKSGANISYVYEGKSMVRDAGINGYNELMYIPTRDEVTAMYFQPFYNGYRPVSAAEQMEALERWIQSRPYLTKHRGSFAERNGDRLPASYQCNLKWQWENDFRIGSTSGTIELSIEILNLLAIFSKTAGQKWELPDGRWPGPEFLGYRDENSLLPTYRVDPDKIFISPLEASGGFSGSRLSRWIIQPGIKITFK